MTKDKECITLPSREEIENRLLRVSKAKSLQKHYYPLIIEKGGEKVKDGFAVQAIFLVALAEIERQQRLLERIYPPVYFEYAGAVYAARYHFIELLESVLEGYSQETIEQAKRNLK